MVTDVPRISDHDRLRVVVWNIAAKARAWPALDRLKPDICLLNEAVVPVGRHGAEGVSRAYGLILPRLAAKIEGVDPRGSLLGRE